MAKSINLIFPHQLFEDGPWFKNKFPTYLIEEYLFFKQYPFHKQKLAFHRASMKGYADVIKTYNIDLYYIDSSNNLANIRNFKSEITKKGIEAIHFVDPTDNFLEQRIKALGAFVELHEHENPQFLNKRSELEPFFRSDKKSFFQTSFYKQQRKERGILMDAEDEPAGGKWTYDSENRKKYPKGKTPPAIHFPKAHDYWKEAVKYVEEHYPDNCGSVSGNTCYYPTNRKEALDWLEQFLNYRFYDFGAYEDAIVKDNHFLHHSVLTPMMNVGLLLPHEILEMTLAFAEREDIPINSTEGFVRQIMGWREFIRGMYECKGSYSRTKNYWNHDRPIPASFYDGTTGIDPIDQSIRKILKTGYCHHIERLMLLGNFMLLCEFKPDAVYQWFMELFIDAYDWVMVPNVYGMTLFADGGTFATKPYIGGSNYVKKMSDYKGGDWEKVWDGLYWNFIDKHRDFFLSNPRMAMMVRTFDKFDPQKKENLLKDAEQFLTSLDSNH